MFNIPDKLVKEWQSNGVIHNHKLYINTMNIYFDTFKIVSRRTSIIERKDYKSYLSHLFGDIKVTTPLSDIFFPTPKRGKEALTINKDAIEYKSFVDRINIDKFFAAMPEEHEVTKKLIEDKGLFDKIIDDCYVHFMVYYMLNQTELIRIKEMGNLTPVVDYMIANITLKDMKNYLSTTRRINIDKYSKIGVDMIFNPELLTLQKFYEQGGPMFGSLDVQLLMQKLISNLVLKSDIYIIMAIYTVLSFAQSEMMHGITDRDECSKYVIDVISKL